MGKKDPFKGSREAPVELSRSALSDQAVRPCEERVVEPLGFLERGEVPTLREEGVGVPR